MINIRKIGFHRFYPTGWCMTQVNPNPKHSGSHTIVPFHDPETVLPQSCIKMGFCAQFRPEGCVGLKIVWFYYLKLDLDNLARNKSADLSHMPRWSVAMEDASWEDWTNLQKPISITHPWGQRCLQYGT
jgi:hypothetical protein